MQMPNKPLRIYHIANNAKQRGNPYGVLTYERGWYVCRGEILGSTLEKVSRGLESRGLRLG